MEKELRGQTNKQTGRQTDVHTRYYIYYAPLPGAKSEQRMMRDSRNFFDRLLF